MLADFVLCEEQTSYAFATTSNYKPKVSLVIREEEPRTTGRNVRIRLKRLIGSLSIVYVLQCKVSVPTLRPLQRVIVTILIIRAISRAAKDTI